ncbi:MAG: envelope stress response membrane protein PspC [Hyphomicrobiales bacterium]|nr:envelope stress response membrane protein PspC [Hyphomicrobiales bacterium]MCP5371897.1 envelope stress response membrane protein PspC [Hyphomicrobiales bacterium]
MKRDARFDTDRQGRQGRHGPHGSRHRRRKWYERAEDFGPSPNKLYRDPVKGKVLGVCAGIADYFGIEVWLVRVVAVFALVFFFVPTVIGYFIAGFVLQPKPEELYYEDEEEDDFWRGVRTDPTQTFSALRHKFKELEQRLRGLESYVTSREFRLRREFDDLERGR